MDVQSAIREIRKHRKLLSTQQMRTLKGQVLSGDIEAAMKGLHRLMGKIEWAGDK